MLSLLLFLFFCCCPMHMRMLAVIGILVLVIVSVVVYVLIRLSRQSSSLPRSHPHSTTNGDGAVLCWCCTAIALHPFLWVLLNSIQSFTESTTTTTTTKLFYYLHSLTTACFTLLSLGKLLFLSAIVTFAILIHNYLTFAVIVAVLSLCAPCSNTTCAAIIYIKRSQKAKLSD